MRKGWAVGWRANGWRRNAKEYAANTDLWQALLVLCEKHDVMFVWVRGHAGDAENERCDVLSAIAARADGPPPDTGFEAEQARAAAQKSLFD